MNFPELEKIENKRQQAIYTAGQNFIHEARQDAATERFLRDYGLSMFEILTWAGVDIIKLKDILRRKA